jgi:hypothetical protein
MSEALKVVGGQESYFTGKLEAYLRAKGIEYQNIPFTMAAVEEAASHTGFFQIPQVECPDTSLIIDYLEQQHPEPRTTPTDPATHMVYPHGIGQVRPWIIDVD